MKNDTRRDAAATPHPGDAGSRNASAIATVSALLEERHQYEAWIASLEARRAATAEHVFARVHKDYAARLDAVIAKLATHADGLQREVKNLSARIVALDEERQRASDERAEAELRAHVGELSTSDWEKTASSIDERLGTMAQRHGALETDLARTRELLAGAISGAPASDGSGVTATVPGVAEAELHVPVAIAEPVREVPPPPPAATAPAVPAVAPRAPQISAPAAPVQQSLEIEAAPAAPRVPALAPRSSPGASTGKGTGFDELAFLSSVVDMPAGSIDPAPADLPDERTRRDSFASRSQHDSIVNITGDITPPRQLAAIEYEQSGEPLLSSPDGPANGARTLKCKCGAMNLPTDWYCESCGNELVTL